MRGVRRASATIEKAPCCLHRCLHQLSYQQRLCLVALVFGCMVLTSNVIKDFIALPDFSGLSPENDLVEKCGDAEKGSAISPHQGRGDWYVRLDYGIKVHTAPLTSSLHR